MRAAILPIKGSGTSPRIAATQGASRIRKTTGNLIMAKAKKQEATDAGSKQPAAAKPAAAKAAAPKAAAPKAAATKATAKKPAKAAKSGAPAGAPMIDTS